jgi:hypothetical protein
MKERPILFNSPMVRALLDGSKTQTRRIVKAQSVDWAQAVDEEDIHGREFFMVCGEKEAGGLRPILAGITCPYGQAGDRLWVRETWADLEQLSGGNFARQAIYCADDIERYGDEDEYVDVTAPDMRWRPSIHMPRWASRILLEITGVRVERLQDIGEVDALDEGILSVRTKEWDLAHFPDWRKAFDEACARCERPPVGPRPSQSYRALWESISGAGSWDANPWVWVVEFKRVQPC